MYKELDTDHYDQFEMRVDTVGQSHIHLRVDPYFVAKQWDLGVKDPSGCLFHLLKTISRFGSKEGNSQQREIESMRATIERLEDLLWAETSVEESDEAVVLDSDRVIFTPAEGDLVYDIKYSTE